jgi:uncharacterized membrane protein
VAGIGFKLRAYTQEGTIGGIFRGYYHAMLVAAGPWILTVFCLVAVQYFMRGQLVETRTFLETIIYIYAWTLITTAPIQLVATRYLADQLDAQKLTTHMPALVTVTIVNAVIHAVLGAAFMAFVEVPWVYRLASVSLFVLVAETWLVMAFIGALRAFHLVATSYIFGTASGILSAYLMGRYFGESGYMMGMVVGQTNVLAIALASLAREFEFERSFNWDWLIYFKKAPALPLAGLFYYSAIWLTLMIYWWGPQGYKIKGLCLFAYPPMDLASFYAQLTIIPTVTAFYVHCETSFYEDYRGFYNAILTKRPLEFIVAGRDKLKARLKDSLFTMLLVQLTVTLGTLTFLDEIQVLLELGDLERELFRNVCIAAVPQVMLLFCLVILFYFQFYREALVTSIVTFVVALGVGLMTLVWGQSTYGLGLLLGTLAGCLVGFVMLSRQLNILEYLTFSKQPMAEGLNYDPSMKAASGLLGRWMIRDGQILDGGLKRES